MKKKILALCLVVVLVATAITGATLAYFTDYTETAKNTFTVGNVDIELDEKDTDDSTDDADRDTENKYDDIFPGYTVEKDPTVTVQANSESCYVRMFVTVDQTKLIKAFKEVDANLVNYDEYWMGEIFLLEKLVLDENGNSTWDGDVWMIQPTVEIKDGKATYEFWYKEAVAEATTNTTLPALFEKITFPSQMTNNQVAELQDFEVTVYAEAIQSEGFDDQAAAWAGFVTGTQQ